MGINIFVKKSLLQDWLISHPGLKRVQKINPITFSLSIVWVNIHVLPSEWGLGKSEWMVRNTKIHKELVIEINQIKKDIYA